jgi:hypothetical protein
VLWQAKDWRKARTLYFPTFSPAFKFAQMIQKFLNLFKMTYIDKNIIDTYSNLFEGLSSVSKLGLIERLTKSLKKEKSKSDDLFYKSFGAFDSSKSPKKIYSEIKSSRKFRRKEISF